MHIKKGKITCCICKKTIETSIIVDEINIPRLPPGWVEVQTGGPKGPQRIFCDICSEEMKTNGMVLSTD